MILRPVGCVIDSLGAISDSSLIPSGVISNAQERTSATGKPAHSVKAGAASGISESDRSSGYTEQESAKVEERLQALGYLE
jgi:hypothetical protein